MAGVEARSTYTVFSCVDVCWLMEIFQQYHLMSIAQCHELNHTQKFRAGCISVLLACTASQEMDQPDVGDRVATAL